MNGVNLHTFTFNSLYNGKRKVLTRTQMDELPEFTEAQGLEFKLRIFPTFLFCYFRNSHIIILMKVSEVNYIRTISRLHIVTVLEFK